MGKKYANNIREISWCVLNCPNIILRDYMCEVFGNVQDAVNPYKAWIKSRDTSKDYLSKSDLLTEIGKLFSDPFVKIYRENLKGRMLNRYFQGEFSLSLVGKLDRYTTVAHQMKAADYWSPGAHSDLGSLVDSLRFSSPLMSDIRSCFGSLCYTTKAQYDRDSRRELTPDYYEKLGVIQRTVGKIPQSGIISLSELAKRENISSPSAPPAPFKNYCSYYFARTPINFHSRISNAMSQKWYKDYFNQKIQERYNAIAQSEKNIEDFLKSVDRNHSENQGSLNNTAQTLKSFMASFSEFVDVLKANDPGKTEQWKASHPIQFKQISDAFQSGS
jgi:hypothetical protein